MVPFPGNRRDDADPEGGQAQGDVVLEVLDLADADARCWNNLVERDGGPHLRGDFADFDLEVGQGAKDVLLVLLELLVGHAVGAVAVVDKLVDVGQLEPAQIEGRIVLLAKLLDQIFELLGRQGFLFLRLLHLKLHRFVGRVFGCWHLQGWLGFRHHHVQIHRFAGGRLFRHRLDCRCLGFHGVFHGCFFHHCLGSRRLRSGIHASCNGEVEGVFFGRRFWRQGVHGCHRSGGRVHRFAGGFLNPGFVLGVFVHHGLFRRLEPRAKLASELLRHARGVEGHHDGHGGHQEDA